MSTDETPPQMMMLGMGSKSPILKMAYNINLQQHHQKNSNNNDNNNIISFANISKMSPATSPTLENNNSENRKEKVDVSPLTIGNASKQQASMNNKSTDKKDNNNNKIISSTSSSNNNNNNNSNATTNNNSKQINKIDKFDDKSLISPTRKKKNASFRNRAGSLPATKLSPLKNKKSTQNNKEEMDHRGRRNT